MALQRAMGYSPLAISVQPNHHVHQRRNALAKIILTSPVATVAFVSVANANDLSDDVGVLKDATEALSSLLENWERATVDCTYADVPRDLLEAKNKEKLLEKVRKRLTQPTLIIAMHTHSHILLPYTICSGFRVCFVR